MPVSAFDLFKIGIGPSSSHTVGPMRITHRFVSELADEGKLEQVHTLEVRLYGSLALTGKGHATDRAVLLGLLGEAPESVEIDRIDMRLSVCTESRRLALAGRHEIEFDVNSHLRFEMVDSLPLHPNGMQLTAWDNQGQVLADQRYYSTGGGFIASEQELLAGLSGANIQWPHAYNSAAELLRRCNERACSLADLAFENELALRSPQDVRDGLDQLRDVMLDCIARGLEADGLLPGSLGVRRRARSMFQGLSAAPASRRALAALDTVNAYAVAVNEENAAGGRVVTAPTNGAAGIVPAVMRFYLDSCPGASDAGCRAYLLTAAAIGSLYKENASISGSEVGCQGEVGVASSMAAAGLTAVLGGTNAQVENAAEIAMEHHLGMTCDPVGGLVQIPCIERNAMGAVKAINAAHLALSGDGQHVVSLDRVIQTMKQTGQDMHLKYKETSLGGLAVSVVEC